MSNNPSPNRRAQLVTSWGVEIELIVAFSPNLQHLTNQNQTRMLSSVICPTLQPDSQPYFWSFCGRSWVLLLEPWWEGSGWVWCSLPAAEFASPPPKAAPFHTRADPAVVLVNNRYNITSGLSKGSNILGSLSCLPYSSSSLLIILIDPMARRAVIFCTIVWVKYSVSLISNHQSYREMFCQYVKEDAAQLAWPARRWVAGEVPSRASWSESSLAGEKGGESRSWRRRR